MSPALARRCEPVKAIAPTHGATADANATPMDTVMSVVKAHVPAEGHRRSRRTMR
jgi:hypothetical protein